MMTGKQRTTGRAASMPGGLTTGAAASVSITLMMSVILAKMVDAEKLAMENVGYGVMVTTILAAFIGGNIASTQIKRRRLLVCALSGCIYYCILLLIATLFFGGQYEGMGVTALIVLAGSGSAFLLGSMGKQAGKGRIRKQRHW